MKKKKSKSNKKLSAGEMEIMGLLWEHGPLTLSAAHEQLGRPIGYTTMQTRLNRLVEKGLASRSEDRPAQYTAAISRRDVSADHLELLVDRVTQGNIVPLVAHLVDDRSLTRVEISELKRIIRDAERRLKEGDAQ
ncbi:MAG: BlaI/MecI/CopY family transcriptional regulator [Pirellulaceae bacterium]|jgi:predicted transcriptional regulator|nr:BlaI/MecI/CopY family transcriptional regulator [Pirellulaceae bacterium]